MFDLENSRLTEHGRDALFIVDLQECFFKSVSLENIRLKGKNG